MRDVISKFLRYMITGGVAALVDIGGFAFLMTMSVGVLLSGCASFGVAALVNFALTSRFVFHQQLRFDRFVLFFGAALLGFALNIAGTVAGVIWLHLPPAEAKAIGILIALLVNFSMNVRVVFQAVGEQVAAKDGNLVVPADVDSATVSGTRTAAYRARAAAQQPPLSQLP